MRQTSIDSYAAIKDKLSAARWRVFMYVVEQPGLTAREYETLNSDRHANKRLSELEKMCVIEARDDGGGALRWFPTGGEVRPLDKRKTWKQRAEALQVELDALRRHAQELRAEALMAKAELIALRTLDEKTAGRKHKWVMSSTRWDVKS